MTTEAKQTKVIHLEKEDGLLTCGAGVVAAEYGDDGTEVLKPATRMTGDPKEATCKRCGGGS